MALKRGAEYLQTDGSGSRFQGFKPRKVCKYFLEGRCGKGPSCTFAHSEEELHPEAAEEAMQEVMQQQPYSQQPPGLSAEMAANEELSETMKILEASNGEQVAIGQCHSSLQGPRQFPSGAEPKQLCGLWIRHPALCGEGDACPFAHGLMETGMDVSTPVKMQTSSDEKPVDIQVVQASSVAYAGAGTKGQAIQLRPQIQLAPQGFGCKGGKAAFSGKGGGFGCKGGKQDKGNGGGFKGNKGAAMAALPAGGKGDKGKGCIANRFADGGFKPMKLCQFWLTNPASCGKGDACSFAHGVAELNQSAVDTCGVSRFHNTGFKPVQMCKFADSGQCAKGLGCTYAHSMSEMSWA